MGPVDKGVQLILNRGSIYMYMAARFMANTAIYKTKSFSYQLKPEVKYMYVVVVVVVVVANSTISSSHPGHIYPYQVV